MALLSQRIFYAVLENRRKLKSDSSWFASLISLKTSNRWRYFLWEKFKYFWTLDNRTINNNFKKSESNKKYSQRIHLPIR
jgi:hypothetical protein